MPKITQNSNWITLYGGNKCKWVGLKLATFDELVHNSKKVQDRRQGCRSHRIIGGHKRRRGSGDSSRVQGQSLGRRFEVLGDEVP